MSSEYHIKLAAVEEYREMLKFKKMYEELCECFIHVVRDITNYSEENNIILPNRTSFYRSIERAKQLIEYRIQRTESPTEFQQRFKTPDDSTEQKKKDVSY